MSWRFRQSFTLIPGVRLNLSKSGLSASIGGAPRTLNVGPRGVYGTASLPGTGVSFRQRVIGGSDTTHTPDADANPLHLTPSSVHVPTPTVSFSPIEEVRSTSTELLTSESLKEL